MMFYTLNYSPMFQILLSYRLLKLRIFLLPHYQPYVCSTAAFLADHDPDWLVQITVARDTLGAPRPAVIGGDVVV